MATERFRGSVRLARSLRHGRDRLRRATDRADDAGGRFSSCVTSRSSLWDLSSKSLAFVGQPAQVYDFIVLPHRVVFIGGIATGVPFGVLGSIWARNRSRLAPAAVALLFDFEPFAWIGSGAASGNSIAHYWWIWSSRR